MLENIRKLFCTKLEELSISGECYEWIIDILIKSINILEKELYTLGSKLDINMTVSKNIDKNYFYKKLYNNIVDNISISSNARKDRVENKRVTTLEADYIRDDHSKDILYYNEVNDQFFINYDKSINLISENILASNIVIRVYNIPNNEKIIVYKANNSIWQCKDRIIYFIFV